MMNPYKKQNFVMPGSSKIGVDPVNKSDIKFYEWLAGGKTDDALQDIFIELIRQIKNSRDKSEIASVLEQWQKTCSPAEYKIRKEILDLSMPPDHPYHKIKENY
ncbi:MAG: hypothetical protein ACOYUZ_03360 [Patescibacteria group bacterium]